ncbi:beta-ketoacyl synthase N-terminal-like domain-containing protein [Planctomycetota bacterium]
MYINGIGVLTSLGIGTAEVRTALTNKETGVFQSEIYNAECGSIEEYFELSNFTETKYHYLDNTTSFTIACIKMALQDSSFSVTEENCLRTGFTFGSIWGCTGTMEKFQQKLIDSDPKFATPFLFSNSFPNSPSSIASIEFGLKGYNTVYSGCANSGFMAFISGCDAVHSSRADSVLAVGTDALSRTVIDFYKDCPANDTGVCLLIENKRQDKSIEIAEWCLSGTPPSENGFKGEVIRVIDNKVYFDSEEETPRGTCMAGAFPFAAAAAADRIRSGSAEACSIEFTSGGYTGYCILQLPS